MLEPRWVTTPPTPCHATGKDEVNGGPYLVEDYRFFPATSEGQVARRSPIPLVTAASVIERACNQPGSPFVVVKREVMEAYERAAVEREELDSRVEELEAELAESRALEGVVDTVLSNGLMERLDERYAKKTGPRPRAA